MGVDWHAIGNFLPTLLEGTKLTLLISFSGVPLGIAFGIIIGMLTAYRTPILHWLALGYIEIIRGTPMLVQVMFIYYALPLIYVGGYNIAFDSITAGIVTIMINSAAYIAEAVRGALRSVHTGLEEAGLALGLARWKVVCLVILPIAARRMIPAVGNQCMISVKDTSLLSVIGVGELMRRAIEVGAVTYNYLEIYLTVGVIYLVITLILTVIFRYTEKRVRML